MTPAHLKRGDVLVLLLAAALLLTLYSALWSGPDTAGTHARVLVEGREFAVVALDQPRRIDVPGHIGTSHLEISDGRIRFVDSPCPNKLCIHAGWQHVAGDAVACLPNRVAISVMGEEQRFDAITL